MACLEMYNSDHKGAPPPMSPRISFSNDFAESHSMKKQERAHLHHQKPNNISTDFEFSVSNNSSLQQLSAADELFFKGRILPLKDNPHPFQRPPPTTTTLRDELLAGDDDEEDEGNMFSLKPPQSSNNKGRWKGFLGLRKSHIGSRNKPDSAPLRSFNEPTNLFSFPLQDQPTLARSPQGVLREEEGTGGAEDDMEMKM